MILRRILLLAILTKAFA